MKKIITTVLLAGIICGTAQSQVNVSFGSPVEYDTKKATNVSTFTVENQHYFIFRKMLGPETHYSLVVCDASGNAGKVDDIAIKSGVFNNAFYIYKILSLGNKILVLVEHRDKEAGKNTLLIRTLDKNGTVSEAETETVFIEFKKMLNSGDWFVSVTPDQKHIAIIGRLPQEKGQPDKFKFGFYDSDLKKLNSGEFTFPLKEKKISSMSFFAADNGNFYFINDAYEKGNLIPEVYKLSASNTSISESQVLLTEPQKVFNYHAVVTKEGNLVMAGYYHENKKISVGETAAKGLWVYDSGKGTDIKTSAFDKPLENLIARGLYFNGNTAFLVGEQYKEDRNMVTNTQPGASIDYTYTYLHKDLLVTGLDPSNWSKKFNVTLSRNWTGTNFNEDIVPAFSILNGKFTAIYNDEYRKYFPQGTSYGDRKLPVVVNVTNDGLMEEPVHFDKEFRTTDYSNGYYLFPIYSSDGVSGNILLLGRKKRDNTMLGVVFSVK